MLNINWEIAKHATRNLFRVLCVLGLIGVASFFVYEKKIVTIPATLALFFLWYVLYRFEIAYRENRLNGRLPSWMP